MTWLSSGGAKYDAIAFGCGELFEELEPGGSYQLLFQAKVDEWNGRSKVKLTVQHYRKI